MPFAVLWDHWRAMQSVTAWQRMMLTKALVLSQPLQSEAQQADRSREIAREMSTAFPAEDADGNA